MTRRLAVAAVVSYGDTVPLASEVAHLDLKAENAFITSWGHLYLTDFASFKPVGRGRGSDLPGTQPPERCAAPGTVAAAS